MALFHTEYIITVRYRHTIQWRALYTINDFIPQEVDHTRHTFFLRLGALLANIGCSEVTQMLRICHFILFELMSDKIKITVRK